ncbi:hypothetical protein [Thermus phage P23-77]|uniref:Uncharacterized protein n=1 Tax=Thermus virus P23-77 TaxID=1714272 RepID=C8CHL9_9VIRU|nr:hypothetical protein P23-77_gp23 [Thermus phage P23-77]ACV05048.1 hypothetical protein [Thermus phage P23-77]
MEWKDLLDSGVAVVGFLAFLRLVFVDVAEMKRGLKSMEEAVREQNALLSRVVNAVEAVALRDVGQIRRKDGR